MIDNYEEAIALMDKMKACLPIPIRGTPEMMEMLQKQGQNFQKNYIFEIETVLYAGDEGGILCALKEDKEQGSAIVSLTHLRIADDHPLAREIKDYQNKRCMRLAIANGRIGKAKRIAKKTKPKKGFWQTGKLTRED